MGAPVVVASLVLNEVLLYLTVCLECNLMIFKLDDGDDVVWSALGEEDHKRGLQLALWVGANVLVPCWSRGGVCCRGSVEVASLLAPLNHC